MAADAIVHVMGTGTIGEPLIGLLTSLREPLGIDEVTFYKHSPTLVDRPKVASLVRRGAVLCVAPDKVEAFHQVGLCPTCTLQEALARATVVIDCSSEGIGLQNKTRFYATGMSQARGFIGQGSEFGFGKPYAYAINDGALVPGVDRFLHVVSCNTHNIAVLVKTIALGKDEDADNLIEGRFVCLRRASDISQEGDFVPGPKASKHDDAQFGTHHARDAYHLFQTLGLDLNLWSSAIKLNTQYMHTLWFDLRLRERVTLEEITARLRANPRVAVTQKTQSHLVFSFGRDHGHYGRILNQTVVSLPTLQVKPSQQGTEVVGFCFTPQDGNSLLSSVAAAEWILAPDAYEERLACLASYLFEEV